ncbi:MAG: phosphoglucosamine mutase [Acidimicrobiia bacterium]|nr:phosphoglucosamine mutase [Acidimicrobiia bacterium]
MSALSPATVRDVSSPSSPASLPGFGTDGVRGPADVFTDEFVVALGRAAARVLEGVDVVIGRDTRASGSAIADALAKGFAREGCAAHLLGVAPTPAVAHAAAARRCPAAVISASHNPWTDNGIKFFAAGGKKLPDATEARIAATTGELLAETGAEDDFLLPPTSRADGLLADYRQHVVGALGGRSLEGLSVVVDCANGAASIVAPEVFEALGAQVGVIHAAPDGQNINAGCGSTHPEDLCRAVTAAGAALGLAFDGDADRVIAVDETGAVVDGDHLLALFALDRHRRGLLVDDTVVVTVMTNLGFHQAMERSGIAVHQTAVGDRYVLEALHANGWSLGGEQSGHIIFAEVATTGDGVLSGALLADLLVRSGERMSTLAAGAMTRLPQVLQNVAVAERPADVASLLAGPIAVAEAELEGVGRVLLRASGTEPLVRVMVEAPTIEQAHGVAERLVGEVRTACGAADR